MECKELPLWKEKSMFEKLLCVTKLIILILIGVSAILQITGILRNVVDTFLLLGIVMIINVLEYRKYNKKIVLINLLGGIFVFAMYVIYLVSK